MKIFFRTLLLGALVALAIRVVFGPAGSEDAHLYIEVDAAQVAHLAARWQKQWNRPPTATELQNAVTAHVEQEILYREALARGLDREDPRVRLSLVQKMQLLAAARADAGELSQPDLEAFYALRSEKYRQPAQLSFTHILFKEKDGEKRARQTLEAFQAGELNEEALLHAGDPTMLDSQFTEQRTTEIDRRMGSGFAESLQTLPLGQWQGPVRSGYGWHLVNLTTLTPSQNPPLDEVRGEVERDLRFETRKAAEEQAYLEIAGKYRIRYSEEAQRLLGDTSECILSASSFCWGGPLDPYPRPA